MVKRQKKSFREGEDAALDNFRELNARTGRVGEQTVMVAWMAARKICLMHVA
jgi:hypothetical protein